MCYNVMMAQVDTLPIAQQEKSVLTPATREVLGEVALDAVVSDDVGRNALVQELNAALKGSGLAVIDTENTPSVPDASPMTETTEDFTAKLFTPEGAIRRFWSLSPQRRGYLRKLSHEQGHGGFIVDSQGKPYFPAAAKYLGVY